MWVWVFISFLLSLIIAFCVKIYVIITTNYKRCHVCMVKKTVIVTGANQGMGYYVALDFAKRGARVIMACRNKEKAEEARKNIVKESNNSDVVVKVLNLASFKSVRTAAFELLRTETRLDILVNNAGICGPNCITEDGLHKTLQVNALGTFLFTILLLDLLTSTDKSRIINLSDMQATQYADLLDEFVDRKNGFLSYRINYANSKKCQALLMMELAERLRKSRVSVHFSLPRHCSTALQVYENWPDFVRFCQQTFIFYFFYADPEDSAQNTIFCALSDKLYGKTGKFWRDCDEFDVKRESVNITELRKIVWDRACRMIHMSPKELTII